MNTTLFDNSMVRQAKKSMSASQIKKYEHMGKEIHSINYENGETESVVSTKEELLIDQLDWLLQAGLPIKELKNEDIDLLIKKHGENYINTLLKN